MIYYNILPFFCLQRKKLWIRCSHASFKIILESTKKKKKIFYKLRIQQNKLSIKEEKNVMIAHIYNFWKLKKKKYVEMKACLQFFFFLQICSD